MTTKRTYPYTDTQRTIERARRYAAAYYRRNQPDFEGIHPSHLATEALEAAGKRLGIGHGAEGLCLDEGGREGISYLNMGDCYDYTVLFDSRTEQFFCSTFGDVLEELESTGEEVQ